MVSFTSLLASTMAALPLASAYITGFTAPADVTAGTSFNVTLATAIYVQNWDDYSIIWGLAVPDYDCSNCIGTQIDYITLTGSEGTAYPYTFTQGLTIPEGIFDTGDYLLKAAIPHLVGASGEMSFSIYSANVTISS
ncbi:hypothetical protein BD289DRAFT_419655 [Coniella lustricola]|uniref:Uncharacterized protein n=1 Tax=Coniella lustricola TaxID=2025994 RepID=A0A2T3ANC8_9PEZI|nr:hypothetical protein BD289DRAFT_419655 [Coniella lustricola]